VAGCGHETLREDKMIAFGASCKTKIPIVDGKTDYCHRCLEKMATRRAWYGEVIFIGDPITLYSPSDKDRKMPDYAVLYSSKNNSYVGCFRWECAESGADRAGFWYPPGKVAVFPLRLRVCLI